VIGYLRRLLGFRLVRNVVALYGVRAVDQLLPIVVIPFLARVLGADGWGLVAGAQALAMYGIITIEYGFEFSGPRAVARGRKDPARLAELVTGILATQVVLAGAIALAALAVRWTVPEFQETPALLWAALLFAVLQGFYPLWFFVGQERIPVIALIGVTAKVIATIVIFSFVRAPEDGWIVLAANGGSAGHATAAGNALVLRQVRPGRLRQALIPETLKLGFSMFAMRVAVLMHTAGNSFLLLLLGGPVQVAFFAAGEKLCRPAAWLLHPVNVALLPRLSHLAEHNPDQGRTMARLAILVMLAVGLAFGLTIGLLAPWLVDLLFGLPEFQPAVTVLRIMALIIPMIVLNAALVSQWMVPQKLDRALLAVIVSATLINLTLALIFAPRYGALGMACITVGVETYILCGLLLALHRRGLKPIEPRLLPSLVREMLALVAKRGALKDADR
jgi:PST family polysaccharide transporter